MASERATSFDYVRRTYRVPAARGVRVTVDGKPGRITRGQGHYIRIRFDGERYSRPCHPTWRVDYHTTGGEGDE
ncbi:MAG TPA: hypothetical protein VFT57_15800 [Gemmatimonadaceae bacterium]|nr:hypothetical protein [Gemmatimonadaceae bacterium]